MEGAGAVDACGAGTSRQCARDVDGRWSGFDTVALCSRRGEATTTFFLFQGEMMSTHTWLRNAIHATLEEGQKHLY